MIKLVVCVVVLAVLAATVYVLRFGSAEVQACADADESSSCGGRSMPPDGLAFFQRRPG
jgi:hypothetical protein